MSVDLETEKKYNEIANDLNSLDDKLYKAFNGQSLNAMYSYRMRIGIKQISKQYFSRSHLCRNTNY